MFINNLLLTHRHSSGGRTILGHENILLLEVLDLDMEAKTIFIVCQFLDEEFMSSNYSASVIMSVVLFCSIA